MLERIWNRRKKQTKKIYNFHCTGKANVKNFVCFCLPFSFICEYLFGKLELLYAQNFVFCFSHNVLLYLFYHYFKYSKYCFKVLHNTPLCNGVCTPLWWFTLTLIILTKCLQLEFFTIINNALVGIIIYKSLCEVLNISFF